MGSLLPQPPGSSKKFVPALNPLESRLLLSRQVTFPGGASFVFPTFVHLPRTGGALFQSGSALTVGVGQTGSNSVNITDEGSGAQSVEWNGTPTHQVAGVQSILVQAGRSRHDRITINLGASIALANAGSLTSTSLARADSFPIHAFRLRTSGTAIQTGSVLNISATSPRINVIAIESWNQGQMVQAQWNGGSVHTFTGVDTIIVDVRNSTKDFVGLDEAVTSITY
jgi:hypothetical protein